MRSTRSLLTIALLAGCGSSTPAGNAGLDASAGSFAGATGSAGSATGGAGAGGSSPAGVAGSSAAGTAGASATGMAGTSAAGMGGSSVDGGGAGSSLDGGTGGSSAAGSTGAAGEGAAGTTGAAGQGAGTLTATWTFPALIKMGATTTFPTYLAHLLGKPVTEAFPTDLACANVVNAGTATATVHLMVSLGVYGGMVPADVSVPAQSSKKTCLVPALDKAALYKLTAPDSQPLDATAKDATAVDVGSVHMMLAIPPVDNIAWQDTGVASTVMNELSAVFVEPNALDVDKLQKLAQNYSVFGKSPAWGDGSSPYQRSPYSRSSVISPGQSVAIAFTLETAESSGPFTTWLIQSVDCSLCTDPSVDVALYTATQYNAAVAGTSTTTTASWTGQGGNSIDTRVLGAAGQYVVVFSNPSSNFVDRTVTWSRSVTMQDVLRDVLFSTFSALRAAGVTYSSVTSTFFGGWQHVRRVTTSLETLSANCIDGTFVFASVAEFLGLQPVLMLRSDHAYVGIRSGLKDSSVVWPIETTLVGSTATPAQAFDAAITNLVNDRANDPTHQEVDVATLRSRGVTPLVQQ